MSKLIAIDPPDCGCMDCCIGESKPSVLCSEKEMDMLWSGQLENRTGMQLVKTMYKRPDGFTYNGSVEFYNGIEL